MQLGLNYTVSDAKVTQNSGRKVIRRVWEGETCEEEENQVKTTFQEGCGKLLRSKESLDHKESQVAFVWGEKKVGDPNKSNG